MQYNRLYVLSTVLVLLLSSTAGFAQQNVVQPGDPVIASSSNSPGSEGVANAIDGKPTKYLNFDSGSGKPAGFIVTPSVGVTRVVGLAMESANDAPDRDPKVVTLEGSNDDTITNWISGNWELIVKLDNIPAWTNRFQWQSFSFSNSKPYKHYRWTVLQTQGPSTCCFQIAEVQFLGSPLPPNVVQPGDPVIASSSNSPGSEGVANAIDGKPTKYLNFDSGSGKPAGFIVTPSVGKTVVSGLTMESANDAPDRDPKVVTLEGSNDDSITSWNSGTWEMISTISNIPPFSARFQTQTFLFDNFKPYKSYRWTVLQTQGPSTCCFQIAEVGFLGTGEPKNVAQPGDPVIASSSNSPGSEGVANAIDGKPTKYLNFDSGSGKPAGFIVTPSVGPTTVTGLGMESANDAPDRDPKVVTLEGSNDDQITSWNSGTWELIVKLDNIPVYTNRFQTQTFFFPNAKSYKHYRWTVLQTQGPSTCCFQIAEVQFLAVTSAADCTKARFVLQPVDTPVLQGSPATFITVVNGPWPLQWFRNGNPIPGATKTSFTTDPVTAAIATNVFTVAIVGCETSSPVHAVIFTPSATKSIGVSFIGGGANGAPTSMNTNDIAGVQPQAFWNNESGGNGTDSSMVDSDNNATSITLDWTTGGTWGAGTGTDTATQRMLNGLVGSNGPGTPNTFAFSNVPNGTHTILIYAVSPPLQFQEVSFKITQGTASTPAYYIRTMNSDEYNAAPGFFRGLSTDVKNPTVADFVRFDGVKPVNGVIEVSTETLTPGFDRNTGINGIQLVLNAPSPGAPPVITAEPQPTVVPAGATARLSVTATGDNLTFQWRKNGRNLPNGGNVSGATTPNLTITSFSDSDVGVYSVAVFNPAGSIVSKNASVRLSKFDISDALIGYWKFDETSGATAANSAPGGKDGKVNGAANWGKGEIGGALGFDGSTTFVFVSDYTKATKQIAASGWVNVSGTPSADAAIIRNAQGALTVSGGSTRIVGQFELGLVFDSTAGTLSPMAAIGIGPNVARVIGATPVPTGGWHQITFSADGAQLRLYVDGNQVGVTDYLADINPPDIPYLSIGARLDVDPNNNNALGPDPNTPNLLNGSLDDLALWRRALTADEVTAIFTAGKQGQPVTSVKETPPVTIRSGQLKIAFAAGKLTISWDNGKLQSANKVTGPWTDVASASSPFSAAPSGQAKFYRTLSQ